MKKIISLFLVNLCLSVILFAQSKSESLFYLARPAKVSHAKTPLLLLLHGVGSNEADLFSFAQQLPDRYLVVSVRAPFVISQGSYKWYDLDFSDGQPKGNPEQAEKSRQMLLKFIEELRQKYTFDTQQVYMCGFSQGAIMSFAAGLTRPDKVRGVIALSGRILDETKKNVAPKAQLKTLQTLVIHGTKDEVLPIHHARQSQQFLKAQSVLMEYHELPLGHSISNETLNLMNTWLLKR
jgi:phospholipase/carboxylesterase